jgi:hypothetical protein
MKAKLIHRGNGDYKLYVNGATYAQSAPNPHRKLSKQNCDEIFGVIDVEKLAKEETRKYLPGCPENIMNFIAHERFFKIAFEQAMELNKDKVFTLEQMTKAIRLACSEYSGNIIDEVTQQPTEIEVTFDPEEKDSEGCLILKKIED